VSAKPRKPKEGREKTMTIALVIDSNAWNFMYERRMDLNKELPPELFSLFITREIEIEIEAIPDISKQGDDNSSFKKYIYENLQRANVKTSRVFGFAEANSPTGPPIYGPLGFGTFQCEKDRSWYQRDITKGYLLGKSIRPSGLTKNQADVSVGASSFHGIVLTSDKKNGTIPDAANNGGKVIYLSDFKDKTLTLGEYIISTY
jgi:hypothetical protein